MKFAYKTRQTFVFFVLHILNKASLYYSYENTDSLNKCMLVLILLLFNPK